MIERKKMIPEITLFDYYFGQALNGLLAGLTDEFDDLTTNAELEAVIDNAYIIAIKCCARAERRKAALCPEASEGPDPFDR